MQNKLKWYIRQSISNWLRNEIRKTFEDNIDDYLNQIDKINKMVDKEADDMLRVLDNVLSKLLTPGKIDAG